MDGIKLKFVNNTNHKPVERDVLTTICRVYIVDFCLHLKTRYNVKVALMEAVLGNSLCLTSEIFTQFTNYS